MPLYRGEQADHLIQDAIVLDLGDLRRQAEQLKARAREQADQIVAEGRAEAERLTANAEQAGYEAGFARGQPEGYQQGLEQGHAEAVANAREQLAQIADAWIAAGQQWDADRRQMLLDARQSMLELALEIAQRVVKRVPQVDPTVVEDQLAAAIDQMARPADVRIRIHPDDRPLIEEAMPRLAETYESLGHAHLIDDEGKATKQQAEHTGKRDHQVVPREVADQHREDHHHPIRYQHVEHLAQLLYLRSGQHQARNLQRIVAEMGDEQPPFDGFQHPKNGDDQKEENRQPNGLKTLS